MIVFIRSAVAAGGRRRDAIAWAKQLAELANKVVDAQVGVMTPVGGEFGRIVLISRGESMASYEANSAKLADNDEFQAHWAKGAELFVPGSGRDHLLRSV